MITQVCIPSLLSLRSLSKLTLRGQKIDDSVMEPLSKLPNLIVLRLHSSKIIGSNLGVLLKVHSLRELTWMSAPLPTRRWRCWCR